MDQLDYDDRGFGTDTHRIAWSDIVAVGIRTTAAGPALEDLFWMFLLREGTIELPGRLIDSALLEGIQKHLPGTDSMKIVQAMGSTDERIFRVWHHEESRSAWNDERFRRRFVSLVERLGGRAAAAGGTFERLRSAWSEEHRRYHDLEHLADCLRELDLAAPEPRVRDVAELALWFHDAVYEPRASDNEERSARLLLEESETLGMPDDVAHAAAGLVRATGRHDSSAETLGAAADLVVDIDLSIFGRDPLRFMDYEYAVAEEFAPVSWSYFVRRGRLLSAFLARPHIYRTRHFQQRYEAAARASLEGLLASPRYRLHRWLRRLWR